MDLKRNRLDKILSRKDNRHNYVIIVENVSNFIYLFVVYFKIYYSI